MDKEYSYKGVQANGFLMLFVQLLMAGAIAYCVMCSNPWLFVLAVIAGIVWLVMLGGYIMLEPNQAAVLIFFGKYKGTFRQTGYHWLNPLMTTKKMSLRIRNLDIDPIKVNDKVGNPILIGMVLVWQLKDTYKAVFDIDAGQPLANFVNIQSDAALREVAGRYAYDDDSAHELTLRSGGEEINDELERKLNERLTMAGIQVVEARINYLAYAPEIAAVMLRRQQASAIISAREKIVEGAVSMVEMALNRLDSDKIVELDNADKARMVGNLLVVLCADDAAQPVIPTGN